MKYARTLTAGLLVTAILGCGPPLSEPSSTSITGHWVSADQVGPLSDVQMDITQQADGTVQGNWSSSIFPPDPVCPPGLGSEPRGTVSGTNTVLEVRLSLVGAGDFQGQVDGTSTLRGSLLSCTNPYAVTFTLVAP